MASPTWQRGPRGQMVGSSTAWIERDRATVSEVARGRAGYALGLASDKSMRWIELTPAHRDERLRPYLERSPRDRSIDR